ncbi:DNA repair protein XRCC3 [Maniola hyperantus]|uniref:DNA repair protein XRCC3 n=1 Tax=Aphantopus hyperantus TaxID=2795564 RepID=UPI00156A010C|nr:DNA repair protein XRCC3 [Maniola hyperantus]
MDKFKNILPSRFFEVTEKAGIGTPKQIIVLSVWDIKKLTNLKKEDILLLKNIVTQYFCPVSLTGDKLEKQKNKIKTGCVAIDNILNGGFRKGTLTEIYGESGTGKTQLVMQVAAHCGSEGSVFICTEDLFPLKRFDQIRKNICNTQDTDYNNMFIEHLTEAHELVACVRVRLPRLLNTNKVSVVILDSVAAPFRCEYTNYVQRAEELKELGMLLHQLAQKYNIAVICVNQVTSTFDDSDNVLPSLGLVWSNMVCYKLKIKKSSDIWYTKGQDITIRELKIVNAPDLPIADAKFVITGNGVENVL